MRMLWCCMGSIGSIGGSLVSVSTLGGLTLPYVTYVGGSIDFSDQNLFLFQAPNLETVGGTLSLGNNTICALDVSALSSVGGDLDLSSNTLFSFTVAINLTVNGVIDLSDNGYGEFDFDFTATANVNADYVDLTGNFHVNANCTTTGYCLWLPGSNNNTGCEVCEA